MPGDSHKLDQILAVVTENNRMLRRMHRHAVWGVVLKIVFYAIIFGVPIFLYFSFVQPILGQITGAYAQAQATSGQLQNSADAVLQPLQGVLQLLGL